MRMPQRWRAAGWICAAISAVLAVIALIEVFRGDHGASPVTLPIIGNTTRFSPDVVAASELIGFLHAVVFGVLAGVAFFVALACFYWSTTVESRQQRAEIIELLHSNNKPTNPGA